MKMNLKKKIHSERGESIGEALAAMLIVALAALMLATMTSAATRIVTRSEEAYASYLDQRNFIESNKSDIEKNASGDANSYTSDKQNGHVKLWKEGDSMEMNSQIDVTMTIIRDASGKIETVKYCKK